jgi:hypothetical protein
MRLALAQSNAWAMPSSTLRYQVIDLMYVFVLLAALERVPAAQSVRFPDGAVFQA